MDKSKHDLVLTGNLQQNVTRSKLNTNLYQQIFKSTIKHGRPKSKHPLVCSSPPPIFHPFPQEWPQRADKASLLAASGMLLHGFLSMFVILLHAILWISGKFMILKVHLLDLHLKTINFLFYNYVFTSSQKWLNILVIFHIIPFISLHSYIIPWAHRLTGW